MVKVKSTVSFVLKLKKVLNQVAIKKKPHVVIDELSPALRVDTLQNFYYLQYLKWIDYRTFLLFFFTLFYFSYPTPCRSTVFSFLSSVPCPWCQNVCSPSLMETTCL